MLNYVDQLFEHVQPQLEQSGILVKADVVESDKAAGTIIWQSIEPSTVVKEGTEIQFKVSGGRSVNTREFAVVMPFDGRETVRLEVYVGDEPTPQFNKYVNCEDETCVVPLTGQGMQFVKVYFDGQLDPEQSHHMQFD